MSKKTFISTILLFAFSLVLVHNIIPHRHHDEVSDISHHEHHSDKQGQDHQDDDNGQPDLFAHIHNISATSKITFISSSNYKLQKTQILKQFIKNADFVFRQLKFPLIPEPVYHIFLVSKQSYHTSYFLRGPPCIYCLNRA